MRITAESDAAGERYYLASQYDHDGRLLLAEAGTRRAAAATIYQMLGWSAVATVRAVRNDFTDQKSEG